jgi:hypothetical protein
MPRRWIPGYGSTPYYVPKRDDYHKDTQTETPNPVSSPTPTLESPYAPAPASTTYQPPLDSYLKDKITNVDPFGNRQVSTTATDNLPSVGSSHPDPATDIYWNDPARLVRYYNAIKTAPQGWQPPSFLNPKQVVDAYNAMSAANGYQDWTKWKPVDASNPLFGQLQQMALPTQQYLAPDELRYVAAKQASLTPTTQEPVDFASLPRWEQFLTYITPGQEGFSNTPWLSKGTSAGISGLLAGLGGAGMTELAIGGVGLLLGGITISPILAAAPLLVGVGIGGMAAYQGLTGKEVPVMNDVLQAFNLLSIAAEKGIGTGQQIIDNGLQPFLDNFQELKAATKAGEATYESSPVEVINLFAKTMDFLDFNSNYFQVDVDNLAKPGESWNFDYGLAKPVRNINPEGVEGLNKLRTQLVEMQAAGYSDEEQQMEVEKFKASFYSSGGQNDMVFGTIIDPANWVPFFGAKIGEVATRGLSKDLSASFRQSAGNLFVDSIPFGIQQGVVALGNTFDLKLKPSVGPLAAMQEYKMRRRYSATTDTVTAAGLSPQVKQLVGLTKEGKFSELQPKGPARTDAVGRTIDWINYLVDMTEDSKATTMLDMFHDNLSQTLLSPELSREQKVTMLQKAAGILPTDMNNVSEKYLGSAAMLTLSEGNKYALQNGAMEVYRSFTDAERDFIPFAIDTANKLGTTVDELRRSMGDPAKVADIKKQLQGLGLDPKIIDSNLKRLKEGMTGDTAIPLSEEEMWTRFSAVMYEKMGAYLTETYKLKPENNILRATHIMKAAQNLMLLGFSPQYLYENFFGNKVAMAAVGVLGFMRPNDIRGILSEMGLDPARIGEGYSPIGDATQSFQMAGTQAKNALNLEKEKMYRARQGQGDKVDLLGTISKKMKGVTKLGLMSAMSAKVEAADSMQAFTVGMMRFYDSEWKIGRGLQKAPLETMWEQKYPGISKYIYSAVEGSKNIPQVYAKLFDAFGRPTTKDVVDFAAKAVGLDPEILSQTFASTGITAELDKGLATAQTPADVNRIFNGISDNLNQRISDTFIREIKNLDVHTAAKIRSEGIPAILRAHTLSETMKLQEMMASKREWDALYDLRNSGAITGTDFAARAKNQFVKEQDTWSQIYQKELMLAKGVTDAFGMSSPVATRYLNGLETIGSAWIAFHKQRMEMLDNFYKGRNKGKAESEADYKIRRNNQWDELSDSLNKMYDELIVKEDDQAQISDQTFIDAYTAKTGWNAAKVKEWRVAVRIKKKEIYEMQSAFRKTLSGQDGNSRTKMWAEFTPALSAKMNELDALEHSYAADIMRGTSNAETNSPIIQSLVDAVETQMQTAAMRQGQPARTFVDVLGQELTALGFEPAQIAALSEADMYRAIQEGVSGKVLSMIDLANQLGMKEEQGGTNPYKLLAIVKKFKHDENIQSLRDVTVEDFLAAMKDHRQRNKLSVLAPTVKAMLYSDHIARTADQVQRENYIKQQGYHSREELKAYFKETNPDITDTQMEAAFITIDARAKQWAIEKGYGDTPAARDAFYAVTFGTDKDAQTGGPRTLKQKPTVAKVAADLNAYIPKYRTSIQDALTYITDSSVQSIDIVKQTSTAYLDLVARDELKTGLDNALGVTDYSIESTGMTEEEWTRHLEYNYRSPAKANVLKVLQTIYADLLYNTRKSGYSALSSREWQGAGDHVYERFDDTYVYPIITHSMGELAPGYELLYGTIVDEDYGAYDLFIRHNGELFKYDDSLNAIRPLEDMNGMTKLDPTRLLRKTDFVYTSDGQYAGRDNEGSLIPSIQLMHKILIEMQKKVPTVSSLPETVVHTFKSGAKLVSKPVSAAEITIPLGTTSASKLENNVFKAELVTEGIKVQQAGITEYTPAIWVMNRSGYIEELSSYEGLTTNPLVVVNADGSEVALADLKIPDYKQEPALMVMHAIGAEELALAIKNFSGPMISSISAGPFNIDHRFGAVGDYTVTIILKPDTVMPGTGTEWHSGDAWTPTVHPYTVTKPGFLIGGTQSYGRGTYLRGLITALLPGATKSVIDSTMNAVFSSRYIMSKDDFVIGMENIQSGHSNEVGERLSKVMFAPGVLNQSVLGADVHNLDILLGDEFARYLTETNDAPTSPYPALADISPDASFLNITDGYDLVKSAYQRKYGWADGSPEMDHLTDSLSIFFDTAGANANIYGEVSRVLNTNMPNMSMLDKLDFFHQVTRMFLPDPVVQRIISNITVDNRMNMNNYTDFLDRLAETVTDVNNILDTPIDTNTIVSLANSLYDYFSTTRYVTAKDNTGPVSLSLVEYVDYAMTKSGHSHENLYELIQYEGTHASSNLATRHLKSESDMHVDANQHGFKVERTSDTLNKYLSTGFYSSKTHSPIIVVGGVETEKTIKADFIHYVADVTHESANMSKEQITAAVNSWLDQPIPSHVRVGISTGHPIIDYFKVNEFKKEAIRDMFIRDFYLMRDIINSGSDNIFEGKIRGVMDPSKILKVIGYDNGISDKLSSVSSDAQQIITSWVTDNNLPFNDKVSSTSYESFLIAALEGDSPLFQKNGETAKGETQFLADGRAVIRGLNAPDISTLMHEVGHVFLQTLSYGEMNAAAKVGGLTDIREYYKLQTQFRSNQPMEIAARQRYVAFEEWFARGWEMYLTRGEAPTTELQGVFHKFTGWMLDIYKRLKNTGGMVQGFDKYKAFRKGGVEIDIKAQVNGRSLKDIFDKMLAGGETEPTPQYHEMLQNAMNTIKAGDPSLAYVDLMNAAQARLQSDLLQWCKNNNTTPEAFIASDTSVDIGGITINSTLAKQIMDNGKTLVDQEANVQMKADANTNAKFVAGQPVRFKDYQMLQQPAPGDGGKDFFAPIPIPGKGTFIIRIKGFEKNGMKFGAVVYDNGIRTAYLPADMEGDLHITVAGKDAMILGYDVDTQLRVVYKQGTLIQLMDPERPKQHLSEMVQDPNVLYQDATTDAVDPVGQIPMDGFPEPEPQGSALAELRRDHIQPALDIMRQHASENWGQGKFKYKEVDPATQKEIKGWIDSNVSADMGQTKRLASKYGEMKRDDSLINYNKRYGIDEVGGMTHPYELWYTRTMINWARRMIDLPAWYAMYARIEDQRRRFENIYLPDRLKGLVRLPAPWLPSWAGGSVYSDPFRRLFQFSSLTQPLQQFAGIGSQTEYAAIDNLTEQVKAGTITEAQKAEAMASKQGPLWTAAMQDAQAQSSQDMNPMTMANMMMSPATWWTTPYYMGTGQQNKVSSTPGFRAANAIKDLGTGTALQPMTDLVGLLGKPEALVREKVLGLDQPTNLFGQYGTYYIEREIANMALDAGISAEDASMAVVQKSGPIWDEAIKRVTYQQTLKLPFALPLDAIKKGANPVEVIGAMVAGGFPSTLFPKGEQEYSKMKNQLSLAYNKKDEGDTEAIGKFYEDYPAYSLRILIRETDPKEQLRMVLANQVWSKYNELGGANKRQVRRYLGTEFDQFISDKEYRDMVSVEQLTEWASGLGGKTPSNVTPPAQPASIPYFSAEQDKQYDAYKAWQNKAYPNWYNETSAYYDLPIGPQRTNYLKAHPGLRTYIDANAKYKKEHPEIVKLQAEINSQGTWYEDTVNSLSSAQKSQLHNYAMGKPLGQGTIESFRMLYNRLGRNSGLKFEDWVLAISNGLNL